MDIAELEAQATALEFPRFDESLAWELGASLAVMAQIDRLGVVINIRTADRTLFHASLPGATAANDLWAQRKSATALHFQAASFLVGMRNRARGISLADQGLDPMRYSDHGGAVPVRVTGVGVVAVLTVSGLPQAEDHALVCRALSDMRAKLAASG